MLHVQKGYVYFQDFIPDNVFDDRVVVIGNRALFLRRGVRKGDFRASGSGLLKYEKELVPEDSLRIAFEVSKKLNTQSLAFDFVYDKEGNPLIVELSYAYSMGKAYDDCPGYCDSDLVWHDKPVDPQELLNNLKQIKLSRQHIADLGEANLSKKVFVNKMINAIVGE